MNYTLSRTIGVVRNLFANIRQNGLRKAASLYWYRVREKYRDRRLGIFTMGFVAWDQLGSDEACHCYEPVNYQSLDVLFAELEIRPHKDVFLDYGSGMGRVIVVAATHPFLRVIGVERSVELSEMAQENVLRASDKLTCKNVELVTQDATTYQVPSDVNVVFLFNPFSRHVMSQVQDRIRESIDKSPREVRLVYVYPIHEDNLFADCQWLEERRRFPARVWKDLHWVEYSTPPVGLNQAAARVATLKS